MGEGRLLIGVGLVAGVALSVVTGTLVCEALFQGCALDVPVIAISAATLVAPFALASWIPSRRAHAGAAGDGAALAVRDCTLIGPAKAVYYRDMLTRRNLLMTVGAALATPWVAAAQKKGADPKLAEVTLEISGMT